MSDPMALERSKDARTRRRNAIAEEAGYAATFTTIARILLEGLIVLEEIRDRLPEPEKSRPAPKPARKRRAKT